MKILIEDSPVKMSTKMNTTNSNLKSNNNNNNTSKNTNTKKSPHWTLNGHPTIVPGLDKTGSYTYNRHNNDELYEDDVFGVDSRKSICGIKPQYQGYLVLLMFVSFFLYVFVVILNSSVAHQTESLEASWLRHKEFQAKLYDARLYTPEQLHLSLGLNETELYVTWSTLKPVQRCELVYSRSNYDARLVDDLQVMGALVSQREFTESNPKWIKATRRTKRIIYTYRARMVNLKPNNLYVYRVTSYTANSLVFHSQTYQYYAKNLTDPNVSVTLALYGDLGLKNGQSIPQLIKDVDEARYDAIIHNGDFAYDLNDRHGEVGDEFMRKIEPIAARVPYQTSVGNHEIAENFTHYDHRFTMINTGPANYGDLNNFFYSFNVGPVHFVAISTEFYYFLGSVGIEPLQLQYKWLQEDLKHASSSEQRALRPWIVVFGHRPMYCSSRDGDDCSKDTNILRKGLPFLGSYALEKMFYDFGVDVQLYSHEHQYERFLPLYDSQVYNGTDQPDDPYFNPGAPVHIISGSAGCDERLDTFKNKTAPGSVKQISDYGFTRLRASRCELHFQQISDDQNAKIVDEFTITKTNQNFPQKSQQNYNCLTEQSRGPYCLDTWGSWFCPDFNSRNDLDFDANQASLFDT